MRNNLRSSKQNPKQPVIINLKKTEAGFKIYELESTSSNFESSAVTISIPRDVLPKTDGTQNFCR